MELEKSLVSGSMSLLVLKLLEGGDLYGYQMIEELRRQSGDAFRQAGCSREVSQMAWGSGRTSTWRSQRSRRSPPPQSSSS